MTAFLLAFVCKLHLASSLCVRHRRIQVYSFIACHTTPSIGLWHPSSTHCHYWLCHSFPNTQYFEFFTSAQMAVSLQTHRQMIPHSISVITAPIAYASTSKTQIIWSETELFFKKKSWVDEPGNPALAPCNQTFWLKGQFQLTDAWR